MKKEEIYVVIDSEEKRLRAIQILTDAGEKIYEDSRLFSEYPHNKTLKINKGEWIVSGNNDKNEKRITLDQLLNPKQEEPIKLDALKLIAESYGFELVEKKREPKVGDFGKFWDDDINNCFYDFLKTIDIDGVGTPYETKFGTWYNNFSHLTDEEKKQIQENW